MQQIENGMLVKIISIGVTKKIYGANSEMEQMVGKSFKVNGVIEDKICLNYYSWARSDVSILTNFERIPKVKTSKKYYFDEKQLVL